MIKFTETSRIMETKVGDYFYKLIINTIDGKENVAILRTKNENKRTGFGSYGSVPMVETVDHTGAWKNLLKQDLLRFPNIETATKFIL